MNRADLRAALSHPNVAAFLRVIRESESRQTEDAYRLENGGRVLPKYAVDHPSKGLKSPPGRAFGAYQFLASTWAGLVKRYGFTDMEPQSQDEAAVALIAGRGALDEVKAGDIDAAFLLLEKEWTSLPGGAEENALTDRARDTYLKWGGFLSAPPAVDPDAWQRAEHYGEAVTESIINPVPSPDAQEANMAPLILPLLQVAAQFLPQIAGLFGSGSEVANRNLAAGKVLAEAITTATNSPNLQAAVEKMAADPEAAKVARAAVAEVMALVEVGGGGIDGARKAAASSEQIPPWKNPAVWFMGAFIPMVYGAAYIVLTGESFSQDAKMMVITAIFSGLMAAGTGFFLGSSLGSQRKTTMLGKE